MKENASAIELMALRESLELNQTLVRWVHANAQLADALTKPAAKSVFRDVFVTQRWKIVHEDAMRSAKVRARHGIARLQDYGGEEHVMFCEQFEPGSAAAWWHFHHVLPSYWGLLVS